MLESILVVVMIIELIIMVSLIIYSYNKEGRSRKKRKDDTL